MTEERAAQDELGFLRYSARPDIPCGRSRGAAEYAATITLVAATLPTMYLFLWVLRGVVRPETLDFNVKFAAFKPFTRHGSEAARRWLAALLLRRFLLVKASASPSLGSPDPHRCVPRRRLCSPTACGPPCCKYSASWQW
jgi:hypothetical protein